LNKRCFDEFKIKPFEKGPIGTPFNPNTDTKDI
jgi:hypothetical protein